MFIGERQIVKNSVHRIIMKICRFCKGNYCFKISVKKICKSIGMDTPSQLIIKSTVRFIHNIIINEKPSQLSKLLRKPRTRRNAKISNTYAPKTEKCRRNLLYEGLKIYNKLPDSLKQLDTIGFRRKIKKITIST